MNFLNNLAINFQQKYYKKINYLPIREYNKKLADKKIAGKAVEQLIEDRANGYNHYIMARCKDKVRAKEVFEYYKEYRPQDYLFEGVAGGQYSESSVQNVLKEACRKASIKQSPE